MAQFRRPDDQDFWLGILSDLYSSKAHADVKVMIRNQEIHLHRALLSLVSPFWSKIMTKCETEEVSEIISDESVDLETWSDLFELVYKGCLTTSGQGKDNLFGMTSLLLRLGLGEVT